MPTKTKSRSGSDRKRVLGETHEIAYTGTKAFTQRYVLKKGKYELVGKDQVPGC